MYYTNVTDYTQVDCIKYAVVCYKLRLMSTIIMYFFFIYRFFNIFFCFRPLRSLFRRRIKKKMLTMEEYEEQGRVETERALNELRTSCRKDSSFWEDKLDRLNEPSQQR